MARYFDPRDMEDAINSYDEEDKDDKENTKDDLNSITSENEYNIYKNPYLDISPRKGEKILLDDYKKGELVSYCYNCNENKIVMNFKLMKIVHHLKKGGTSYNLFGDCNTCGSKLLTHLNFERCKIKNSVKSIDEDFMKILQQQQ